MIKLFNTGVFQDYHLVANKFKRPEFACHKTFNAITASNLPPKNMFFDRTGILPCPLKTTPTPLPLTDNYVHKDFETLSLERAQQFLDTGERLHLWWSGGIDSTSILASFALLCKDPKQIVVHMSTSTLLECGTIFEEYIRPRFPFEYTLFHTKRPQQEDGIHVSGYLGNTIMGQGSTNHDYSFDEWELPWRNFIDKHHRMKGIFIDYIQPIFDIYPKEIRTFFDYQQFYLHVFRWHQDAYIHEVKKYHVTHFHNTIDFERWVMYSHEPRYGEGLMKLPMKKLIFKVFPDVEYYRYKRTQPSVIWHKNPKWTFLLDDGSIVNGQGHPCVV